MAVASLPRVLHRYSRTARAATMITLGMTTTVEIVRALKGSFTGPHSSARGLGPELVAEALHCQNEYRLLRIVLQLLAQIGNPHIHGACMDPCAIPPHISQQHIARKRLAPVLDEKSKQLKLSRGEIHDLSVPRDFRAAQVDTDRPELVDDRLKRPIRRHTPE